VILSVTLNPCVDHALFVEHLNISDTNRVSRTETDAGGKGVNFSRVVAELGGVTTATGFLGGGPGAFIRKVLEGQGVQHDFVDIAEDTRMNFSVEDTSGVPPTTLNEKGPLITSDEWNSLLDHVSQYARKATWVALGGSLPPGVPIDAFATLTNLAKDCGAKVLLDADGEPLKQGLVAIPQMIKPNAKEASRLLGTPIDTLDQALVAVQSLLGLGTEIAIISRGADGAVLATKEGVWSGGSPTIETHSTIGSGDSLLGGFLWALESGKPIDEAFRYGLAAGAATATTDGSEIARRPVIDRLLPDAVVKKM
jgi:1-phosphofructokinase family hexose kinase